MMEIIDAHAHIYPEKIAEKATKTIGEFYDLEMEISSGTTERLIEQGKKAGIDKFVVHSCATKANQVRSINEFIKSELDKHPEFIGFMTLHQDLTEEEIKVNAQTYFDQMGKVIDLSKNVKVVRNSDWLNKMTFADVIKFSAPLILPEWENFIFAAPSIFA